MIKAEHLCKTYGRFQAVKDVSFQVEPGEVLGVLGPNGAGKSTTLRMVTGYLRPTAGRVEIQGIDLQSEPVQARRHLGYLPENAPLYYDCTVKGFLEFIAGVRGVGRQAVKEVMDTCQLADVAHVAVEALSKGYRHRTCFAQALLGDPENLILDEPTDGLDPNQKYDMRQLVRQLGKSRAVVVSTHILEEVEAVCTRIAILSKGRLVFEGTAGELRQRSLSFGTVRVCWAQPMNPSQIHQWFATCTHLQSIRPDSRQGWYLLVPKRPSLGSELLKEVQQICVQRGICPCEMMVLPGDMEEVFRRITEEAE